MSSSFEQKLARLRDGTKLVSETSPKEILWQKLQRGLAELPISGWKVSLAVAEVQHALLEMSDEQAERVLEILRA